MAQARVLEPPELLVLPPRPRAAAQVLDSEVRANFHLTDRYWQLRLHAPDIAATVEPGQFCMLTVTRDPHQGAVLPRPMAVYAADQRSGDIDVVYSVAGAGTRTLSTFAPGERVTTVGPLGRGFDLPTSGRLLLLGRGIGTCSLTMLAAQAVARGHDVTAVASGRHPGAVVGAGHYDALGIDAWQVTDEEATSDPDLLRLRLMTELDDDPPTLVAACGSARLERLATALGERWGAPAQVALEAHMACGLGYCHGCSTGDRAPSAEAPLICRDGPVFATTPGCAPAGTFPDDRLEA